MKDNNGASADRTHDVEQAWLELHEGLSDYLSGMVDPDEGDHLIVELPGGGPSGCTPYAQFASFAGGTRVRAEISGNGYLMPGYRVDRDVCAVLREHGWAGNDASETNWFLERAVDDVDRLAWEVVGLLKTCFGIAHPQLLTYQAWGPAAAYVDVLGLCATDDVPAEAHVTEAPALATMPANTNDLLMLVEAALQTSLGTAPTVDDDGDFVIEHLGQTLWVRVLTSRPAVEIMACVVRDVRSRRAAAVELSVLNRDHPWVKWALVDREVWQTILLPGQPFVPRHLDELLTIFRATWGRTRDDLVLRTGGRVG